MAYTHFDKTTPAATQSGTEVCDSTRANLLAIRDMAALGVMPGWSMAASGGTAEQPTQILYSNGTERLRKTITWGTVGGAIGNPETVAYAYSANSGTDWQAIGTLTITFDSSGNVTAQTWS